VLESEKNEFSIAHVPLNTRSHRAFCVSFFHLLFTCISVYIVVLLHQAINKSLAALSEVVAARAEGGHRRHVPYRNSTLTYLLQDALSGKRDA